MRLKKYILSFIAVLAVTFMAVESAVALEAPANLTATVNGNKVTLNWDAVSGATGYKVYYGYSSGNYNGNVDVGNVTSQIFENVPKLTYYVAVTAYDGINESSYSNKNSFTIGSPGESYKFERLWPTLPQPWYFEPKDMAVDEDGYVYVADGLNKIIHKFTFDGDFVTKWGSEGSGDGQFGWPHGIAVDSNGNVYVVDGNNRRIQKFDSNGNFIAKWGSEGSGDGQFSFPQGIAVDSDGNIYVADTGNDRIQKFDSGGNFIIKWGSEGIGDGQFDEPEGIAIDSGGNVYVVDKNNRVQKFNSNGIFITKWGSEGSNDGQFNWLQGIAVDNTGNVYVADSWNYRIQKFDSEGNFIS